MRDFWRRRGRAHVYGDNLAHDGQIVPMKVIPMRLTQAEEAAPYLFEEHDSDFALRVRPGDFIVAGRNFGCGKPHTAGYLGMTALGLSILCESLPYSVSRSLMNIGVPYLADASGLRGHVSTGDELEVDFIDGSIRNLDSGQEIEVPPLNPQVRAVIEAGGLNGRLRTWLEDHPELGRPLPYEHEHEGRQA